MHASSRSLSFAPPSLSFHSDYEEPQQFYDGMKQVFNNIETMSWLHNLHEISLVLEKSEIHQKEH